MPIKYPQRLPCKNAQIPYGYLSNGAFWRCPANISKNQGLGGRRVSHTFGRDWNVLCVGQNRENQIFGMFTFTRIWGLKIRDRAMDPSWKFLKNDPNVNAWKSFSVRWKIRQLKICWPNHFKTLTKKISRILKREENRNERFYSSHQVKLKSYVNGGEYVR